MNPETFEQVERIFQSVRKLAPEQRAEALREQTNGNPALRREVESLLAAYEGSDGEPFLDTPALGQAFPVTTPVTPSANEQIGRYRIIEPLGEGGMATVYVAEQERPRRRVALKIMKALLGPRAEKRFELEAMVLGRLRHPGIAQIYEAGIHQTTSSRLPYIAMELVEGERLTDFVRKRRLDLSSILRLFARICDAVEHAHQRGVIHRDLKPSNILVEERDGRGLPKLLDLGIARATDVDVQATTMRTNVGELVGTIQYMSPEQAAGDPEEIDTRSDVYSLGVILFELLSERLPYDLRGKPIHEAVRSIREVEPLTLSSVNATLRGDLEAIALKAMEKEKTRRYQSAGELAADIRRHLNNEPITARPPSAGYQLRKFARRNRTIVIGAACFIAALLVGLAGTIWFAVGKSRALEAESEARAKAVAAQQDAEDARQLAERRFDEVRQLSQVFIDELDGQIRNLPGATEARQFVVSTGLAYLDGLAAEAGDNRSLRLELGYAYFKLGDIQGYPDRANLGDREGAWESYQKGLDHIEAVYADAPDDVEVMRNLSLSYSHCAVVLAALGRRQEAAGFHDKAFDLIRRVHELLPDDARVKSDVAYHENRLGDAARDAGDADTAAAHYAAARHLYEEMLDLVPGNIVARRGVAAAHDRLGRLAEARGRTEEALAHFDAYIKATRAISDDEVEARDVRIDLAAGYDRKGINLRRLGDRAAAREAFAEGLRIREALFAANPKDMNIVASLRSSFCYNGEEALAAGDHAAALRCFEGGLSACRRVAEAEPNNAGARRELAVSYYKMAEYHVGRAADESTEDADSRKHRAAAQKWLEQCREEFQAMQRGGLLAASDAGVIAMLDGEIAACTGAPAAEAAAE